MIIKLTDLRIYSASWTLPKLLILRSSDDRFRPQNPRILVLHQGTVVDRLPVSPQLMILPGLPGGCLSSRHV